MPTVLDKIEADANARLPLPEGRRPGEELPRYRDFVETQAARLRRFHQKGGSGRLVCLGRAAVIDQLLRHLLRENLREVAPASDPAGRFALVAIGGYGRAELSPHSDIDLLFLHNAERALIARGKGHPRLSALIDGMLYPLWDLKLKVGHAVRSVEDCVRMANTDMQSKTSLLEARFIAGDRGLYDRLQAVFLARCVRGFEDKYIAARLRDQEARRAKHGGSACMQEPNIKNGCGGLRDYQNLLWMAFFKYRTRTLAELEQRELATAAEHQQLDAAYDFLLRVRNAMHFETHRASDVLVRSLQPVIATQLGHTERSPVKRIESFMQQVYTHLRNVHLITRTLEQRLALLPHAARRLPSFRDLIRRGRRRVGQQMIDGFQCGAGEIRAANKQVFREDPTRLMRVFFYAQQRGLGLHPDLAQSIRSQLGLVDREFLVNEHVARTFLEMLNQRGNVAPVLRAMHEVGFLGRYLPEFGRLTCLVQHEFYHQYTADEHTLACLDHLDRIWEATTPPHANYSEIFQSIDRPFQLYLALLLHDAGKAERSGQHSEIGAEVALDVARRLGLDGAVTHSLRLIIEHHLLMASVSQRRDLDDPVVIRQFAAKVQSVENLKLLTLHTLADSLGTSDQLWNGFKDALLMQLYRAALEVLTGASRFIRAAEREREVLFDEVRRLVPADIDAEEVEAHAAKLPARYYHIHSAEEIMIDLKLVHEFMHRQIAEADRALAPVVDWRNEPDRGYTVVRICTWDRSGLFSKISGAMTAAGLNIFSAQVFTREDGIILDVFRITDSRTGLPPDAEAQRRFERLLVGILAGEVDLGQLIARQNSPHPLYHFPKDDRIPAAIRLDNGSSEDFTVLDLETEDHVGLLHAVSRVLTELELDIVLAKIQTEKGAAIDSFYVRERPQGKVLDPARQAEVIRQLGDAIGGLS
ncbi:MAG: [protein-PII] uridylyltransferase [Verrucomicrobia bacterium]|nr:[protein-PII] uridylyltransferase [Verrucomicrobiota bacterium]